MKNLQGDVVSIVDAVGEVVVEYTYDAWGKLLTTTGTMASTVGTYNPFRYRGYYYDSETGWYYLQSRYYDPVVGRFLNADGYASTGQGFLGNNMFVYCGNNPVVRYDSQGLFWKEIWKGCQNVIRKTTDTVINFGIAVCEYVGADTSDLGASILHMNQKGDDIYSARRSCWQKQFGYCELFDVVFDTFTYMKSKKMDFDYEGKTYVLWLWKGDYMNLGAGAEIGLYYDNGYNWAAVDTNDEIHIKIYAWYKNQTLGSYNDTTWWATVFNSNFMNASPDDISVMYMVAFNTSEMYNEFINKWGSQCFCFDDYSAVIIGF